MAGLFNFVLLMNSSNFIKSLISNACHRLSIHLKELVYLYAQSLIHSLYFTFTKFLGQEPWLKLSLMAQKIDNSKKNKYNIHCTEWWLILKFGKKRDK